MIGYVTLGTNDLPRAVAYYDALFASINIGRAMEIENYFVAWSAKPKVPNDAGLAIAVPFDQKAATVGNGVMVALFLETKEKVDTFYAKALELGGTCEGKPGFRPEEDTNGFYAGYFRDLDGNKLNAYCMIE